MMSPKRHQQRCDAGGRSSLGVEVVLGFASVMLDLSTPTLVLLALVSFSQLIRRHGPARWAFVGLPGPAIW
jgi:hypothetical protein